MRFATPQLENYTRVLPPAFGLDISDSSIKFAYFTSNGRKLLLQAYGERDLKPGIIERGELKQEKIFLEKLNNILDDNKYLPRYIVAGIMEEDIFIKTFLLPRTTKDVLESEIIIEAENSIPIPLKNAVFDYALLSEHQNSADETVPVVFAAVQNSIVNSYITAFRKAGLTLIGFEPESFAIARSIIKENSENTTLIVELGATRTRLAVYAYGSIILTGSAIFSSNAAAKILMQKLRIDKAQAQELLWSKDDDAQKILQSLLMELAKEIAGYISFFATRSKREHWPYKDIGAVLLSGGSANITDLEQFLSDTLELPVKRANPFVNLKDVDVSTLSKKHALRYSATIGLAMRAANSSALTEFFVK